MKKVLSLLIVCVLIGCSEKRVLIDELTNKGTKKSPTYYSEDGLFNGIMYNINSDGVLIKECVIKDGKLNGLYKEWKENGRLGFEENYIDGKLIRGKEYLWYANGGGLCCELNSYVEKIPKILLLCHSKE